MKETTLSIVDVFTKIRKHKHSDKLEISDFIHHKLIQVNQVGNALQISRTKDDYSENNYLFISEKSINNHSKWKVKIDLIHEY